MGTMTLWHKTYNRSGHETNIFVFQVLRRPENSCGLEETKVRDIMRDVGAAVEYLHKNKIIHRDLKPENVLMKEEDNRVSGLWVTPKYTVLLLLEFAYHFDGSVQERRNSSALAMELHLSCSNPLIWYQSKRELSVWSRLICL